MLRRKNTTGETATCVNCFKVYIPLRNYEGGTLRQCHRNVLNTRFGHFPSRFYMRMRI